MLKFLFLTDTHYRDDKPKGRTDDIMKAQFDELGEVLHICNEEDIDVILHGGDFFNTKKPSHRLVVHILDWCKMLSKPIVGVIGNHDITGYNLDSVINSGLGVLFESGAVERLENMVWQDKEKVVVKAVHSSLDFNKDYMFDSKYDDHIKIILSHNYVIPTDSMPWGFVHPKDIKTNADLVLCGHYHVAFDYTNGKTRWINPGAVSRWKITERDHTPQVLFITVNKGKLNVAYRKLTSSRPGHEIFDVDAVEILKQQERNIEQFARSLEETSFQDIDIEQVVRTVGKAQDVGGEILELILTKLREAKEVLK
jgi:DNA repair exonuclease SbcCD nuclease subunit